jgi:hypothetical protein
MEALQPTTNKRWIIVLWLILSQLASLILLLVPWVTALTVTALMMAGGALFVVYVCLFPIIPALFIIASWILYARRKDKAAAISSGVLLLLSIAAFLIFMFILPPASQ